MAMFTLSCNAPRSVLVETVKRTLLGVAHYTIMVTVYSTLAECIWLVLAALPLAFLARAAGRGGFWLIPVLVLALVSAGLLGAYYGAAVKAAEEKAAAIAMGELDKLCQVLERMMSSSGPTESDMDYLFNKMCEPSDAAWLLLRVPVLVASLGVVLLGAAYLGFSRLSGRLRILGVAVMLFGVDSLVPCVSGGLAAAAASALSILLMILVIVFYWVAGGALKQLAAQAMEAEELRRVLEEGR